MLVLSRKEGESIVIQGRIRISVLNVGAHKVRIGIEAPRDMAVHRREVWEAIMNEVADAQDVAEHALPTRGQKERVPYDRLADADPGILAVRRPHRRSQVATKG